MADVDAVLQQVLQALRDKQKDIALTADTDLWIDLDLDSLSLLEMIEHLEGTFEIKFFSEAIDLREISTPRKIADLITQKRAAVRLQDN